LNAIVLFVIESRTSSCHCFELHLVLDLRQLLYHMVPHTCYVVVENLLFRFLTRFTIFFYHCEPKCVMVMAVSNSLGTKFCHGEREVIQPIS